MTTTTKTKTPMKIEFSDKIMHAAADCNSRYAISSPLLTVNPDKAFMTATDGRIATVRTCEFDIDSESNFSTMQIMPQDFIKRSNSRAGTMYEVRMDDNESDPRIHKLDRNGDASKMATTAPFMEGSFPPFGDIFPAGANSQRFACVSLSVDLLKKALDSVVSDPDNGHKDKAERAVIMYVPIQDGCGAEAAETGHMVYEASTKPVIIVNHSGRLNATIIMPVNSSAMEWLRIAEADKAFRTATPKVAS